jgi:hypothetical protein
VIGPITLKRNGATIEIQNGAVGAEIRRSCSVSSIRGTTKLLDYITIETRDAGMDSGRESACWRGYSTILRRIDPLRRNAVAESAVNRTGRVRAAVEAHA